MEQIKRNNLNFNIRPNTLDEWIVDEVLTPSCYMNHLCINSDDIVLDIGMNIGVFSVIALQEGAEVVAFEPEAENYAIAKSNIELNNYTADIYQMGISNKEKQISLYLNNKKNRGNHSTTKFRGRSEIKINCADINKVLKKREFTKIKMDCEGEEYKIIMAVKTWMQIKKIRFEWHRRILQDENNFLFTNMIEKLESDGFDVIAKRDGKGWTQMITANKK